LLWQRSKLKQHSFAFWLTAVASLAAVVYTEIFRIYWVNSSMQEKKKNTGGITSWRVSCARREYSLTQRQMFLIMKSEKNDRRKLKRIEILLFLIGFFPVWLERQLCFQALLYVNEQVMKLTRNLITACMN
jgi:hypothetical protein